MVRKKYKKGLPKFLLLIVLSAIIFTGLIGAITFQNIFPTSTPYVTSSSTVNLSYGIHAEDGLSSITHSWNGTNTTLYDYQLVAFYNFDNRSELGENDTIVKDISMYGNNGTVVGGENISWTPNGKYGGAFNFSGSKNYINIPDNLIYSNFTISMWVYKFGGAVDQYLMSADGDKFKIIFRGDNKFYMGISYDNKYVYSSDAVYVPNNWYNLILLRNDTHIFMYVNNNFKGIGLNNSLTSVGNLIIGYNLADNYRGFNGTIDDIMIFNRTLSNREIDYLYNSQLTKYNSTYYEQNITNKSISTVGTNSFICSANLTLVTFCSVSQEVRQVNTIKSNFSNELRRLNYFYGVQSERWGSNLTWINTTGSSTLDTLSNYNFMNNIQLNLGTKIIRTDMALHHVYNSTGFINDTKQFDNYGNINTARDLVRNAYINNEKVLFIMGRTPEYLANKTSGYCNSSDWNSCSPENYTAYADLVVDFLDEAGCDIYPVCMVEGINEPDVVTSFLNNISNRSSLIISQEYNKIYNATYDAIKAWNPSIQVGGISTSGGYSTTWVPWFNLWNGFLSELSNKSDFYSYHKYYQESDGLISAFTFNNSINSLKTTCLSYGGSNCSNIYVTEFNYMNTSIRQDPFTNWDRYSLVIANMYLNGLNNNLTSMVLYKLQDSVYSSSSYGAVAEYGINGSTIIYYPPYNVTKNFAHLCPAGATVYVSSNDDDTIKQVACQKGNMYSLIVINTDTNVKNITVNMTNNTNSKMFPYTSIMNYETGASIPVSTSGIAQLGVLDSYEVVYLTSGDEDGGTLVNLFKLNEYTGSVVYDTLFGTSNGTRSGATWVTDGVLRTLTSVTDYVFSGDGILTLTSSNIFSYLFLNWDLSSVSVLRKDFTAGIDNVSGKIPLLFLVLIVGVILIVLGGLTALFYLLMKKVPSRFSGGV